jgi:unsaturated rhamnogalacturonyl hydrolase
MVNPFLAEYGKQFNDSTYANDETSKQLTVYASHLQQSNGLMRHAYDEAKAQTWADPVTGPPPIQGGPNSSPSCRMWSPGMRATRIR